MTDDAAPEVPRRIECRGCHHSLRPDGASRYRHSGKRGDGCACSCEGRLLSEIGNWFDLDDRTRQRREISAPVPQASPGEVAGTSSAPTSAVGGTLGQNGEVEASAAVGPVTQPDSIATGTTAPASATTHTFTPVVLDPSVRRISNSEVQSFKSCRRRWWLGYVRGLKPRGGEGVTGVRSIGIQVHLALSAYYSTRNEDPLAVLRASYDADTATHPEQAEELGKDRDLAVTMVEGYLAWVAENGMDEGLEIIADEATLEVPSGEEGVNLIGRLDVRVRRQLDGARLFVDHKTVADFVQPTRMLHLDQQMMHYMLLERLDVIHRAGEDVAAEYVGGALYNMLKRSKRTTRATPPFYDRVEVHHNDQELRNFWAMLHGTIARILEAERALAAGTDHHWIVPPTPTRDCPWRCEFFTVCGMMDDGSDAEGMIEAYYEVGNPYQRYLDSQPETQLEDA